MSGERYTSLHAAQSLAKNVLPGENNNLEAHLSKREQMILAELRRGNTTDEISQELNISPRTVESYYARIIEKLNLDGMKSLRRYAFDTERDRPVL
jgi:DNA-binding NarL/FixJ family response regulator